MYLGWVKTWPLLFKILGLKQIVFKGDWWKLLLLWVSTRFDNVFISRSERRRRHIYFCTQYSWKIFTLNFDTYFSRKAPTENNVRETRKSCVLKHFFMRFCSESMEFCIVYQVGATCLVLYTISLHIHSRYERSTLRLFNYINAEQPAFRVLFASFPAVPPQWVDCLVLMGNKR